MRPNEWVSRAPVSSSRMSQTISRAFTNHKKGVNAPSSIAMAPSHVRWSLMRASSPRAMRVPLAPLRHREPAYLLDRERVAHVVQHRRDVVQPVDVGEDLRPRPALAHLLEAPVQIADLDVSLHDRLARELEDDPDGPVHRGMRRAHVEVHGIGRKLELALVEFDVEGLHQLSSAGTMRARPKGMPSSGPNGSIFCMGIPASSSVRYGMSGCVRSAA